MIKQNKVKDQVKSNILLILLKVIFFKYSNEIFYKKHL